MGAGRSHIKERFGSVSGKDIARMEKKYGDTGELMTAEEAQAFVEDVRETLLRSYDEESTTFMVAQLETVVQRGGAGGVLFCELLVATSGVMIWNLTESASREVYGHTYAIGTPEEEPDEKVLQARHGVELTRRQWEAEWELEVKAKRVPLVFDPLASLQPGTLAAAPRDVLIIIFLRLGVPTVYACSRVCRKFFMAANEILKRTRSPSVHLCFLRNVREGFSSLFNEGLIEQTLIVKRGRYAAHFALGRVVFDDVESKVSEYTQEYLRPSWMDLNSIIVAPTHSNLLVWPTAEHTASPRSLPHEWRSPWHVHERQDGSRFGFSFASKVLVDELHVRADGTTEIKSLAMQEHAAEPFKLPQAKTPTGSLILLCSSEREWFDTMITYNPEARTHSVMTLSGYFPAFEYGTQSSLLPVNGTLFCFALRLGSSFGGGLFFLNVEMGMWSLCSLGHLTSFPCTSPGYFVEDLPPGVLAFGGHLLCVDAAPPVSLRPHVFRAIKSINSPMSSFILNRLSIQFLKDEAKLN